MKLLKTSLFISFALFVQTVIYAQNIFPSTGSVGIGTLSPSTQLQTTGTVRFQGIGNQTTLAPATLAPTSYTNILVTDVNGNVGFNASALGPWTPVEAYGAVGNGTTDDRAAIQAAIDDSPNHSICLSPGKTYLINGSLTMGTADIYDHRRKSLYIPQNTTLLSNSTGAAIILESNNAQLYGGGTIKMNNTSWGNGSMGVKINGQTNIVDIGTIEGFDYGVSLISTSGTTGVGYNNINVRLLHNNKYSIYMGITGSGGWVNQNYIHFNQIRIETGYQAIANYAVGIYMNPNYSMPNTNTFSGSIEGVFTGLNLIGCYNRFEGLRLEGCYYKVVLRDSPDGEKTRSNYFYGDYGADLSGSSNLAGVFNNFLGSGNTVSNAVSVFGWAKWTMVDQFLSSGSYVYSDSTYKTDIKKLEGAYDKIMALKGTSYKMKTDNSEDKNKREYGFIAQELQKVLPELVVKNPFDGKYAVNYIAVIPFLVEAMKEQQKKIDDLESKINSMNKGK